MTRENILFAIIGILLGFIVGFMFASSMSQKAATPAVAGSAQGLPADHPPVGGAQGAAQNPQAMQAQVQASLEKARNEPQNFDAQIEAADLYYQIRRYDQALEYLLKANQLSNCCIARYGKPGCGALRPGGEVVPGRDEDEAGRRDGARRTRRDDAAKR